MYVCVCIRFALSSECLQYAHRATISRVALTWPSRSVNVIFQSNGNTQSLWITLEVTPVSEHLARDSGTFDATAPQELHSSCPIAIQRCRPPLMYCHCVAPAFVRSNLLTARVVSFLDHFSTLQNPHVLNATSVPKMVFPHICCQA